MSVSKLLTAIASLCMIGGIATADPVFRTATDETNPCEQGNRVELRVFLDNNDEEVVRAEFVIEHPSADFNFDSVDSNPGHDGNIDVEELSDDGDESRIRVVVTWPILSERDFEEGTLVELDFIVQRDLDSPTRFQLENDELVTVDGDQDTDVDTSATEPLLCGSSTPTPTPTIAPSPTPGPGTTIYSTSFDTGTSGWTTVSVPGVFDEPTFTNDNEALGVNANGSSDCFGFWKSPRIAVTGGQRLEITWSVRSTSADNLTPTFRLRTADGQFRYNQFLAIESPVGGVAPGTSIKEYVQIYDVPADSTELELAFDLTAFNATDDDNNATVELTDVAVKIQ